jgi:hypothetical protein
MPCSIEDHMESRTVAASRGERGPS